MHHLRVRPLWNFLTCSVQGDGPRADNTHAGARRDPRADALTLAPRPSDRMSPWMVLMLVSTACGETPDPGDAGPGGAASPDSISVTFTRAELPVSVRRAHPAGVDPLQGALDWLVRGPTEAEGAEGVESWFSEVTAGSVRYVALDDFGHLVVDFDDLSTLIPGASSSTGSGLLLRELNGTVFTFPEVESVEYRMEGSCARFWEWLQYDCQSVGRPPA